MSAHSFSPQKEKEKPDVYTEQEFEYFLVLDFEATCQQKPERRPNPQEIIEFPVIAINSETLKEEFRFHHYVRPTYNPQLSTFCTDLTGITQEMVETANNFYTVFREFNIWMEENFIKRKRTFAFVCCGDWDFSFMIVHQCRVLRLEVPKYFDRWINIKSSFKLVLELPKQMKFIDMMKYLGLEIEGRHHSGIDDCHNISRILISL
ncbi:UNVERIFIED_CONTAM: hypothetical protein GTU68_048842, partial [Idotea baltica]|nr:hypothetical protein [Idotea baltica]